ncbi:methyltransferase [Brachybacterium sp. AOP43-C2-M15]|uniref:methyltransferase n=1 Tax=Brachybacterium sp. AOP43-C2-M15 TaxID=3457661 RepID=UPI0040333527
MSMVSWIENGSERTASWRSENGAPAPDRIEIVDDAVTANAALRRLRGGAGLLWRGDFHNARQLLKAVSRRIDHRAIPANLDIAALFRAHRAERAERALVLGRILVLIEPGPRLALSRAPVVAEACREAYGEIQEPTLVALTELQGVLSAHQWHVRGVPVPALGARIHPRHSVFSPSRSEYVDLVARAALPETAGGVDAVDLGTGTGVLAAVLARRGAVRVVATDINPRAVDSARENMQRLGLEDRVSVLEADLFPPGRADLVVCNPPWLPGEPTSRLELGIYDDRSDMLRRFLDGLGEHLTPGGEGWLVLSDLAEHLGLRGREELLGMIRRAGLEVIGTESTSPRHPRAADPHDLLHAARSQEVTTLWRLRPLPGGTIAT